MSPIATPLSCTCSRRGTVRRRARAPKIPVNFRADEADWRDALATADAAGENLPDHLREFLRWYARKPGARAPRRPATAVRADEQKAGDQPTGRTRLEEGDRG